MPEVTLDGLSAAGLLDYVEHLESLASPAQSSAVVSIPPDKTAAPAGEALPSLLSRLPDPRDLP